MSLDTEGLEELIEQVTDYVEDKIYFANRIGELDSFLEQIGFKQPDFDNDNYQTFIDGKIVVIGQTEVKKEVLLAIAKKLGLDKSRFEFHLEYNDAIKFQYKKLNYNPNYRLVMFGPIPHSTCGKGNSSNVIAEMENTNGYPKVVRLTSNKELKITKHNFEENLRKLIDDNYL